MTRAGASLQTADRVRLDEALADNEGLRRLASSVAHDFNSLLTVITGYSELLLRQLRPNDPLRGNAESIKRATEWGIALAQQVLAASRRQGTAPCSVSLNQAVANVTRVLRPALGERIELVTRLDPASGRVAINQGQLGQVVMNLVVNARDAMPAGGRLVVETAPAGAEALLSVSDTGVGMDDETRLRLFEPYFTTKEPGKGMGLGLATVYDVVTQRGGRIEVASEPGQGSTFRIFLPRVEDDAEGGSGSAAGGPAAVAALTVLVVEDEAEVREVIRERAPHGADRPAHRRDGPARQPHGRSRTAPDRGAAGHPRALRLGLPRRHGGGPVRSARGPGHPEAVHRRGADAGGAGGDARRDVNATGSAGA